MAIASLRVACVPAQIGYVYLLTLIVQAVAVIIADCQLAGMNIACLAAKDKREYALNASDAIRQSAARGRSGQGRR